MFNKITAQIKQDSETQEHGHHALNMTLSILLFGNVPSRQGWQLLAGSSVNELYFVPLAILIKIPGESHHIPRNCC